MTNRARILAVLNGQQPTDRLPKIEWATWWTDTIGAWEQQGVKKGLTQQQLFELHGLDSFHQFWVAPRLPSCPVEQEHGQGIICDEQDYEALKKYLYSQEILDQLAIDLHAIKQQHDDGDSFIWFTLEGFFWYPRTLFGIEPHLFSFYDYPTLMHQINQDQAEFSLKVIETICNIVKPEFMTFAEDMSYNHGPMLSKDLFDQFLKPYYNMVIPAIKKHGVKVLIDTDGDVEPLIPWFQEVGIEGVLPLERQAGVDVNRIRQTYPEWIMIGGFDKTIMCNGEQAMRSEFERIFPTMQSGRYIPSVDHQTPPNVSIENYRIYMNLLEEYTQKAVSHNCMQ